MDTVIQEKLWKIITKIPFQCEYWLKFDRQPISSDLPFFQSYETYLLEFGPGWGELAVQLAKGNPKQGFVLVEKKKDRLQAIYQKIKKEELRNIRLIYLNFNWFLKGIFEKNLFHTILINFPDPWPKKKHHKHRTVNLDFIEKIHCLLVNQGKFYFATDNQEYAKEVLESLERVHFFSYTEKFSYTRKSFPISYFEKIQKEQNKPIYYIERKNHT